MSEVPRITLKPVKSSSVIAAGFEAGTLVVQFKGGRTYTYTGVPADINDALHKAESIGKFMSAHVVGKFPHKMHETKAKK